MPTRTDRLIAAISFAIYLVVNLWVLAVIPAIGPWDWSYFWGEPTRDALVVAAAMAIGLPLFLTTLGAKPT